MTEVTVFMFSGLENHKDNVSNPASQRMLLEKVTDLNESPVNVCACTKIMQKHSSPTKCPVKKMAEGNALCLQTLLHYKAHNVTSVYCSNNFSIIDDRQLLQFFVSKQVAGLFKGGS